MVRPSQTSIPVSTSPGWSAARDRAALAERVKELQCLYGVSEALAGGDDEAVLERIVDLLPPSFQFPAAASARIELAGGEVTTSRWPAGGPRLGADVAIAGEVVGRVEVEYAAAGVAHLREPFLAEEAALLRTIAGQLADWERRRRAERALAEREDFFRTLLAGVSDMIAVVEVDSTARYLSPSALAVLGRFPTELLGYPLLEQVHPADRASLAETLREVAHGGSLGHRRDVRARHREKGWRRLELAGRLLPPEDGAIRIALAARDVTERRRAEDMVRHRERQLALAVEISGAGVFELRFDPDHPEKPPQELLSPALLALTGRTSEEIANRDDYLRFVLAEDQARFEETTARFRTGEVEEADFEYRMRHVDGSVRWLRSRGRMERDEQGRLLSWTGITQDITEHRQLEQRLRQLAFHDPLTWLPNRAEAERRLAEALGGDGARTGQTAVLFVDLDRFKVINDSLGHRLGDETLSQAAARLRRALRPEDLLARFGGDEFVAVLEDVPDAARAVSVGERLLDALDEPLQIDGRKLRVGASIGVALGRPGAIELDDLLRFADIAMYRAKSQGGGRVVLFEEGSDLPEASRLQLEGELAQAADGDELVLHFQPVVGLADGSLVGAEALLRWRHPERGLIPPGEFLPLAEETGLIVPIGEWVLGEACRELARWRRLGVVAPDFWLSVNLSARELEDPGLLDRVTRILATTGAPAEQIVVEITESALVTSFDSVAALRKLGLRVALDDFGTGYASLSSLRQLVPDLLKIDRSFVRDLGHDPSSEGMAAAVLDLARALGQTVIAEGIETGEQASHLRELGCTLGQGFYLAPPLTAGEIASLAVRRVA